MNLTTEHLATTAVCIAECARDALVYLKPDADRLATTALEHLEYVMANPEAGDVFRSTVIAADALALVRKIDRLLADLTPRLAEIVAMDGQQERERQGTSLN